MSRLRIPGAVLLLLIACTAWPGDVQRQAARPQTVRVAGVVLKWLRGDKEANYRRLEPMIRQAAASGARIVCTTECFLDGYAIADKSIPLDQYRALGEPVPGGQYFRRLAGLAKELKIYLVAGMLEADGEARYNTATLIGPHGVLIGKYHKQRLEHEAVRNTAGGMFGTKSNDPILQARSRENRLHIIFVHPAEFLVTGPDGTILERTVLGDKLLISGEEVGTSKDSKGVFYFDLPL